MEIICQIQRFTSVLVHQSAKKAAKYENKFFILSVPVQISCISIPAWSPPCVVASSPRSLAPCPRHRESWSLTRGTTSGSAWAASSVPGRGQRCDSENFYDHFYADTIFGSFKSSRSLEHSVFIFLAKIFKLSLSNLYSTLIKF